jgi:hypothetical protein
MVVAGVAAVVVVEAVGADILTLRLLWQQTLLSFQQR